MINSQRIRQFFRRQPDPAGDASQRYQHASQRADAALSRLADPLPLKRRRFAARMAVLAVLVLAAGLAFAYSTREPVATVPALGNAAATASIVPAQRPRIEAVFVLDTTGSMSGLINAARENIWSIATAMAQAQPTPELRIGLVAFRDRGDDYVTRVTDLSSDLDSMYAELMDFQAAGGGDFPEAVNEALFDAVNRVSWSQDSSTYRVIFLVGDAPPQLDYQDDVKYPQTLMQATAKGIVVNTIQAGSNQVTQNHWQQIASLGQGVRFEVGMHGNALAVNTPYDDQIARLSRELDATRLFYGSPERQRELAEKEAAGARLHAAASPQAIAGRAEFNASPAGRENYLADADLVADIAEGRVELDRLSTEQLPPSLREMDAAQRLEAVTVTGSRRRQLEAEIKQLSDQRSAHIAEALAERDDVDSSLDAQILSTVRSQAAEKGFRYE